MDWKKYNPPTDVRDVLEQCPKVTIVSSTQELVDMACGGDKCSFDVVYDVPGKGRWWRPRWSRVRNGISVNYPEPYMRRRDPDCLVIGDDMPTDKESFYGRFGQDFAWCATRPSPG